MRTVIFGANGGIGQALTQHYLNQTHEVWAVARSGTAIAGARDIRLLDYEDHSLAALVSELPSPIDRVLVCTGALIPREDLPPEKSLRQQSPERFQALFHANTIVPAQIAKLLLPRLPRNAPSLFAALSARVGSIGDNRLGGWHGYRASKAALNMLIRCYAIEMARTHPQHICLGLHPGTVDTGLSKPFQGNVPAGGLFSPEVSAAHLARVIEQAEPAQSGQVLDWSGKVIPE
jgi:NAD(P)-dependent dehydrogenase (short-subunit alcohol dehydrogenase family)